MLKAVAYARFSSDNQREESIEAQLRAINEYASRNNIVIIDKFIDQARSATTDNRPGFQKMIEFSNKESFEYVIVHKLDRFSRDRYDSAIYKRKLKQNGIKVLSVLENLDNSPESVILESVLEGMSEYYSKNLSREVKKGHKENAYKCKFNGGSPPLGFDVDENQDFIINDYEAQAIKIIYEMYSKNTGYSEIIDELNRLGYKTKKGKDFGKNSLYEILKNEKYKGTYVYNRRKRLANGSYNNHEESNEVIKIENGIPQIISDDLWIEANNIMIKRKHGGNTLKAKVNYLLSGLLKCGYCGGNMVGQMKSNRKSETRHYYYVCGHKKRKRTDCPCKSHRKEKIEDLVLDILYDKVFSPDAIESFIDKLYTHLASTISSEEKEFVVLKEQLKELNKEEEILNNAILNGVMNQGIIDKNNTIQERKKSIAIQIESFKTESYSKEEIREFMHEFKNFKILSEEDKKELLNIFIYEIRVFNDTMNIKINSQPFNRKFGHSTRHGSPRPFIYPKEFTFEVYIEN